MKLDNNNLSLLACFDLLLLMFIFLPAVQAVSDSDVLDNRWTNISISEANFQKILSARHLDPNNQRTKGLSDRSGTDRMSVLAASDVNITRVGISADQLM